MKPRQYFPSCVACKEVDPASARQKTTRPQRVTRQSKVMMLHISWWKLVKKEDRIGWVLGASAFMSIDRDSSWLAWTGAMLTVLGSWCITECFSSIASLIVCHIFVTVWCWFYFVLHFSALAEIYSWLELLWNHICNPFSFDCKCESFRTWYMVLKALANKFYADNIVSHRTGYINWNL